MSRKRRRRRGLHDEENEEEEEEEEEEDERKEKKKVGPIRNDEERKEEERNELRSAVAPGAPINNAAAAEEKHAIETNLDGKEQSATPKDESNDKNTQQHENNVDHARFIRHAAKKRINYERLREKQENSKNAAQRLDNVIFPPLSLLLIDDYMLISSELSSSSENQGHQGGSSNAKFRKDVTDTYKTLSSIYSSLSNHLSIHTCALGK